MVAKLAVGFIGHIENYEGLSLNIWDEYNVRKSERNPVNHNKWSIWPPSCLPPFAIAVATDQSIY